MPDAISVTALLAMILVAISLDRHDRRVARLERELGVAVLEHDAYGKALREPDPVECRLSLREPLDGRAVLLVERPSDALHAAAKALVGLGEHKNLGSHAGLDVRHKRLAAIRNHVP